MKRTIFVLALFAWLLADSSLVSASPIIRLESGGSIVTIGDGAAGDVNTTAGAITFIGTVGVFSFSPTTLTSAPLLGGVDLAQMVLSSARIATTVAGSLQITVVDNNFSLAGGSDATAIGRAGGRITGPGTVSVQSWVNTANALPFTGLPTPPPDPTLIPTTGSYAMYVPATTGQAGTGIFALTDQVSVPYVGTPFSLITQVTLNFTGAGNVSFSYVDASLAPVPVVPVPEPASMLVFGTGLLGLGLTSWLRRGRDSQRRNFVMKRTILMLVLSILFLQFGASAAQASPIMLRLQSGASVSTITDQGAGDLDPTVGTIFFNGTVGVFDFNMTTGVSGPGDLLSLNSVNILSTSTSGGNLAITVFDDDFQTFNGVAGSALGIVTGELLGAGTVTVQSWVNNANAAPFTGPADPTVIPAGSIAVYTPTAVAGPGQFSFTDTASFTYGAAPVSMITQITLNFTSAGSSNFSQADLSIAPTVPVPEPGVMLLFGTGLLGLAAVVRRSQRKGRAT